MKILDTLILDIANIDYSVSFSDLISFIRSLDSFKKSLFWANNSKTVSEQLEILVEENLQSDYICCGLLLLFIDSGHRDIEKLLKILLDRKSVV